ncbi:MAG: hypothetical protein QM802_21450 [Agriterribacter sp.]
MTEHDHNKISRKKKVYPVSKTFKKYLKRYGREMHLPISYEALQHFQGAIPCYDSHGKDTLWETVFYNPTFTREIHQALIRVYSLLKAAGANQAEDHLHVERIDFCAFGNSQPFRVKVVNNYNDVYSYLYIKIADASRILGLELEHLLSPYSINYLLDGNTLIEEHIAGVPGDMFIADFLHRPDFNPKRIAKEFVKFNERCFARLLGDMRSYNFVFEITPDFDDIQFCIRAIDFDQQSYEGRKNFYLPQFFKENKVFVQLVQQHLNPEVIEQYQQEERAQLFKRIKAQRHRLGDLKSSVDQDELAPTEKIQQLAKELSIYFGNNKFLDCKSMADILRVQLRELVVIHLNKR